MSFMNLDQIDSKLLFYIEKFLEISAYELSLKVFLSRDAVRRRLIKLKEQNILIYQKKPDKNGILTHYFSLAPNININLVHQSVANPKENFCLDRYLSNLSNKQLQVLAILVFADQKISSTDISKLAELKPSTCRSILAKLCKDKIVKRSVRKDNPNFFNYYLSNRISKQKYTESWHFRHFRQALQNI